jgi:hypothetical protein
MKVNKNLAISENGFVFNPATGDSFSVNELGVYIVNLIRNGKSKNEIVEIIAEEYNAEKSNIERDFNEFLNVLSNHQLIDSNE